MNERDLHRLAGERFRELLRHPRDERARLVEELERAQPEVATEVRSLLAHHDEDSFLETPAGESAEVLAQPERIGSYRILRTLGWGGSGVVYLAEQEKPRRRVAVKLLRWDSASPVVLERFEREAEVLGRLEHPGIARVYEAGRANGPLGEQPFIAMEFVEGTPLAEATADLDLRQRVELAASIADIVEHAHAQSIVHRDLKPANVLLRGDGSPVVLDFGIAREIGGAAEGLVSQGFETVTGQVLGTLAYMSPEQASGREVDVHTDVYALGVVAYELVTGHLPYDTRDKLITEAVKAIELADPTPLSHYGREFGGDLETVIAMALRKEPERRYASAGELADDLRRSQDGRPIRARRASRTYFAQRFVRRRWKLVSAVAALLLTISVALVVSITAARTARAAERRAELENAATQRLADQLLIGRLRLEMDTLWPATPDKLPSFDAWLTQARDVLDRRPLHVAALEAPEQNDLSIDETEALRRLVSELDEFRASLTEVTGRRSTAASLEARSIDDYAERWSDAIEAVRTTSAYDGFELTPQVGLVPLGADPASGLEEFAHLGVTGAVPERDESGALVMNEESAIVFVLIPGGAFWFGAQSTDPNGIQYDPHARDHEGPPERVTLDPFFLSKYELNQSQWVRMTGSNPSYHAIGDFYEDFEFGPLTPVESLEWEDAVTELAKIDLTLPTETQWERAARGGTSTVWWTGNDPDDVHRRENLNHREDGFRLHAPIGSFDANPFGLHDMLGNLNEWCLDVFKVSCRDHPLREGDGLRLTPDGPERSARGGSATRWPNSSTSARRDDYTQSRRQTTARPARSVR